MVDGLVKVEGVDFTWNGDAIDWAGHNPVLPHQNVSILNATDGTKFWSWNPRRGVL